VWVCLCVSCSESCLFCVKLIAATWHTVEMPRPLVTVDLLLSTLESQRFIVNDCDTVVLCG